MNENNLKLNKPIKKHPKKKQVKLTRKEIEELMGVHRDTFRKVNGSWRRK